MGNSGPPSESIFQRSGSNINESATASGVFISGQHLSQAAGRRSYEEPPESQRNLDDITEASNQPPTFTKFQRPENSNPGNDYFDRSSGIGSAPGIDGHVRFHDSKTSDLTQVKTQVNAPGLTDQVHKNRSMAGDDDDDEVPVSLVGGTFKEVNPTAYYVERK